MLIYNSSKGYGAVPQAVHWVTVIFVAVAWIWGFSATICPKVRHVMQGYLYTYPPDLLSLRCWSFAWLGIWSTLRHPPDRQRLALGPSIWGR